MGLSSNILWHQTKKDGLKGIINDRCLYFSYSLESLMLSKDNSSLELAFPMISVCDLPLAETAGYLKKYGGYTVGFSADWGKKNGFSPVWYCDNASRALHSLLNLFSQKRSQYGPDTRADSEYESIVYLLSHVKQYEGPLLKKKFKRYRFYDEREQRLVPELQALDRIGEHQFINNYNEYKENNKGSSLLPKSLMVPYEWKDVKYIIVERDTEKEEFRNLIEKCSSRTDLNISFFTNKEVKEDIIGLDHNIQERQQLFTTDEVEKIIEDRDHALLMTRF